MRQHCEVHRPGLIDYETAWSWQRRLLDLVRAGGAPHQIIVLQHPPVFTLGRGGRDEHLLVGEPLLAARGARALRVDRGGDVTFHGPGQIVVYPVVDLRRLWGDADVPRYVRTLEAVIGEALAHYGIDAARREGKPGVWVGDDKIAAIGVRVSRGVTMHGFALNVTTDLAYFDLIVPCGIRDGGVTSMERLLGRPVELDPVADRLVGGLSRAFGLDPVVAQEAAAL